MILEDKYDELFLFFQIQGQIYNYFYLNQLLSSYAQISDFHFQLSTLFEGCLFLFP